MTKDMVYFSVKKNDLQRIDSARSADNLQSSLMYIILENSLIRLVDGIIYFNYYNGNNITQGKV